MDDKSARGQIMVDYSGPTTIPGFKPGMSNDFYHADPAISSSRIKTFSASTLRYLYDQANPPEPSPAMQLGTAAHCAILEPEKFADEFAIAPESIKMRRGKAWDAFLEKNPAKAILTASEAETVRQIGDHVRRSPVAAPLVKGGIAEMSCFWPIVFEAVNGDYIPTSFRRFKEADPDERARRFVKLMFKVRPDYLPGLARVVDLKTTNDPTPESFAKAVINYKYHWSAFLYCGIISAATKIPHNDFYWIAAQNCPPFEVNVYRATPEHFTLAQAQLTPILSDIARRTHSGDWVPIGEKEVLTLDVPRWAFPRTLNYSTLPQLIY